MGLTYRREIDGLRAIAVGAVVLYHAGFGPAAGFVGVDVFFVISGYLITALLLREKSHTGRINLADFYARRVRRIFPAAALVLLAVLAVVPILPPPAREGVFESAAAASLFGANVYFHLATAGYFTGDAGQFPLLHLWSLSVEEQFYLLWPALLMLGAGRRSFAVIAIASFALCEWLLLGHPSAAFYQMPARAWELAAGALIAASAPRAMPRWSAWAGLAVVLAACVVPLPHFPGLGALPAVAGAALVLAAIHGGATNPLLASRPFVGVGLISYSLYLWHWPLLAIDRLMRVGPSPWETRAGLVALAVLLAFASYRYVETPLRRPWASSRRTVVAGFGVMAALACGAWTWRPEPPPKRVEVTSAFSRLCYPYKAGQPVHAQRPDCMGKGPKVLLLGDSMAHSWEPLAESIGDHAGLPVVSMVHDGCPAIVGADLTLRTARMVETCARWNAESLAYLRQNGADVLVITNRWVMFLTPGDPNGAAAAFEGMVRDLAPTVGRVVLIAPTPTLPDTPDKCRALGSDCAVPRAEFEATVVPTRAMLARLAKLPNVEVIDPVPSWCSAETCPAFRDGRALYADAAHISPEAARQIGDSLRASPASHQLSSQ